MAFMNIRCQKLWISYSLLMSKDKATNKYHDATIVGKPDSAFDNDEQRLALLEGELFGEEE